MLTTHIIVPGADAASRWYAESSALRRRAASPCPMAGSARRDVVRPSVVMMADEFPEHDAFSPAATGCTSAVLYLQTEDVDGVWTRALAAARMFSGAGRYVWGEREGQVTDPFGHRGACRSMCGTSRWRT